MKVEVVEDNDPVRILKQFLQLIPFSFCRHGCSFLENPNIHKKLAQLLQDRKKWLSLHHKTDTAGFKKYTVG
jgi:hypothetical protein